MVLTAGADRMAEVDPHGWTLPLISVSVVFIALIILFFVYKLIGKAFSEKPAGTKKQSKGKTDEGVAAAIALALDCELSGSDADAAAIALALHLYCDDGVHDRESGIITISRTPSSWDDKSRNFRKLPVK